GSPTLERVPERVGSLAVHPPALAPEEDGAHAEGREQEAAHPRRRARAVVLLEEAEVPAEVLAVEPPAVAGAADVHDLGLRVEPGRPARLPEAVAPVDLLREHEERLVEEPDPLGGGAADEQARA